MESGVRGKTEKKEDGMEKGKETKLVSNKDGIRSTREGRKEGRGNKKKGKRKAKLVSNEDRIKMDEGRQEGGKRE